MATAKTASKRTRPASKKTAKQAAKKPIAKSSKLAAPAAKKPKIAAKKAKVKPAAKKAKRKSREEELGAIGIVIVDDGLNVDREKINEERKAYLEEARSQEAFD